MLNHPTNGFPSPASALVGFMGGTSNSAMLAGDTFGESHLRASVLRGLRESNPQPSASKADGHNRPPYLHASGLASPGGRPCPDPKRVSSR